MSKKNVDKNKKRVKIGIIIFFGFAVLTALLAMIDFEALYLKLSGPVEVETPTYSEEDFYPADYYTDIMIDPVYLETDRTLTWCENGITEKLIDNNYHKYKEAGDLVYRYYQSLIKGDAKAYNALFSEKYKKENGVQDDFPMQRVYDMKVTVLERSEDNIGAENLTIKMEYKIQRNDGTVRNDMLSDMCVPIDIRVTVPAGGSARIESITRYYDGNSLKYPSLPVFWAIVLLAIPIIMIGAFVVLVVIILKKKKKKAGEGSVLQ